MGATLTEVFDGDIDGPIARIGLTSQILKTVRLRALDAAFACNENDPPTFKGTTLWAKGIRFLAEEAYRRGWTRGNENNQPLVFNEAKTIAITVASGDKDTGNPNVDPLTRARKGDRTRKAIRDNRQQSFSDWLDAAPAIASTKVVGRATWFLLMYRDKKANVLRSELSLPSGMDEKGRVDHWLKRIILPDIPFDEVPTPVFGEDNGNGGNTETPEITVEITRLG